MNEQGKWSRLVRYKGGHDWRVQAINITGEDARNSAQAWPGEERVVVAPNAVLAIAPALEGAARKATEDIGRVLYEMRQPGRTWTEDRDRRVREALELLHKALARADA